MNDKHALNNALSLALTALHEYDKFGYIRNHQAVIKMLLQHLTMNDSYAETVIDQELLETSAIMVERVIQKAKR